MQNAGLNEAQAGIKSAGRNINNLRYADNTTLIAKVKRNLLVKVKKESEKAAKDSTFKKLRPRQPVPSFRGK